MLLLFSFAISCMHVQNPPSATEILVDTVFSALIFTLKRIQHTQPIVIVKSDFHISM